SVHLSKRNRMAGAPGPRRRNRRALRGYQGAYEVLSVTNSETISRIAGLYKWQISKTANFEQKLSVELGEDNDVTKSESSLSAEIVENLALKVSYSAKHQSEVPIGNEDTETVSSFTVVYSF
ncbi:MAG: DUF481 domain-containing protein, partial [Kangiellaceae bacterium]|nr:DUF481 domain-containing protein [Kangiellaceae bacterium]